MSSFIVLLPILLIFGWAAWAYNRLVHAKNQQAEAWSGVDVQLKKRSDLVPPLVECVSAYRTHEAQTFRDTAAARAPSDVTREIRGLLAVASSFTSSFSSAISSASTAPGSSSGSGGGGSSGGGGGGGGGGGW